jgi:hypothetical protein
MKSGRQKPTVRTAPLGRFIHVQIKKSVFLVNETRKPIVYETMRAECARTEALGN